MNLVSPAELQTRLAVLSEPRGADYLFGLIRSVGFTNAGYLQSNPNLAPYGDVPNGLIGHFAAIGAQQLRPTLLDRTGRTLREVVETIAASDLTNAGYRSTLLALIAREFIMQSWLLGAPQPPVWENSDAHTDDRLEELIRYGNYNALPYFVIGDGHSRLYQSIRIFPDGKWLLPIAMTCSGGSARTLGDAASSRRYGLRIIAMIARIARFLEQGSFCFFKFGQVDVEYLYTHRWSIAGTPAFDRSDFDSYADECIELYIGFLKHAIKPELRQQVCVCSICPPASADENFAQRYVRAHFGDKITVEMEQAQLRAVARLSIPNICERTALHGAFNDRLRQAAEAAGFIFEDDFSLLIDKAAGKLPDRFTKNGRGEDIHIVRSHETISIMERLIRARLDRRTPLAGMRGILQ